MFALCMDESGVEVLHSPPAHFFLLGVMIPADSWKNIAIELEAPKEVHDLREPKGSGGRIQTLRRTRPEDQDARLAYDLEVHGLEVSKVHFLGRIHDLYADDLLPLAHI